MAIYTEARMNSVLRAMPHRILSMTERHGKQGYQRQSDGQGGHACRTGPAQHVDGQDWR